MMKREEVYRWLKEIVNYFVNLTKPKKHYCNCHPDCQSYYYATSEGALIRENLFTCPKVQKQMKDMKKIFI